jgi:hypothetical protein
MRDEAEPLRDRLRAMEFLTERMLGRAVQAIELSAEVQADPEPVFDPSTFTTEELELYVALLEKSRERSVGCARRPIVISKIGPS